MIEKGFVKSTKTGTRDRVLSILKKLPSEELVSVPILGKIACGAPIWVEENFDGEVLLPKDRLGRGDFFALRTEGDSMINAGIGDGDLVVIRQQPMADNGEIVAAYINGEVTLKRFSFKNNIVTLNPENESYTPIVVAPDADFRILGVFKMVSKVIERLKEITGSIPDDLDGESALPRARRELAEELNAIHPCGIYGSIAREIGKLCRQIQG